MVKRLVQFLLGLIGICSGCSKSPVLTPSQFTKEFAEAVRLSFPGVEVKVVKDLELKVTTPDGNQYSSFLDNPYGMYLSDPTGLTTVRESVVAALKVVLTPRDVTTQDRIVPVIKSRLWFEGGLQSLSNLGAKEVPEYIYDNFSKDLFVFYGEDLPGAVRFLMRKDLEAAGIEREELRALACENLKRLLPKIECHGSDGVYMVTAGGTYEASLLLLDGLWNRGQMDVRGDIVLAIPTRDLLLVTGSEYPEGIDKVRQMVKDAYGKGPYSLTPKLFVYRDGRFIEFGDGE